jgi:cytochrome bd-type quinol oxidase subunit 2
VKGGCSCHFGATSKEVVTVASPILQRPEQPATPPRGAMTRGIDVASRRVRVAAILLILGLVAGPVGTHVYWMLGGTWGLYGLSGAHDEVATTAVRVVAGVVVVLLVAAILVVLARVGLWQQAYVSDRLIRIFAWALAGIFLLEALAAFTWSREHEWWMYGPVSLVIAVLALVVANSGGAWPRLHRPHRTLASH